MESACGQYSSDKFFQEWLETSSEVGLIHEGPPEVGAIHEGPPDFASINELVAVKVFRS
jgi:hypothetical protein